MPKLDLKIKTEINLLSNPNLVKLVIKAASQSEDFYNYLIVNYLDKDNGEKDLFEKAKVELKILLSKSYKGYSLELVMANMLAACNKRINEFSKISKDHSLSMDLIMMVLETPFALSTNHFTTCFTRYNQQVYLLVKKAITLLKNKLHEDYQIQYAPQLNEYLTILHRTSGHLDYVYSLPKSI